MRRPPKTILTTLAVALALAVGGLVLGCGSSEQKQPEVKQATQPQQTQAKQPEPKEKEPPPSSPKPAVAKTTTAANTKPNILVIWGDDVGIWNISANSQGMMGYRTPNIDRIYALH